MLIKTRGIVLRAIKYSETSLICDIYTEEKGRQSYIISGVRKRKAKISPSLLQVMSLLDMVVYHKSGKSLNRTKEIKPAHVYSSLPFDVVKGSVGLFMVELTQKAIKEEEANPELFDFLYHSFLGLDLSTESVANYHLCFMIQLAKFLGFMPGGQYKEKTPYFDLKEGYFVAEEPMHADYTRKEISPQLSELMDLPLEESHTVPLSRANRQLLLDKLIHYYQYHVEGFTELNAYTILKEVF